MNIPAFQKINFKDFPTSKFQDNVSQSFSKIIQVLNQAIDPKLGAYYLSATQTISSGVETKISFDTLISDENSLATLGSGFIYTVPTNGIYAVYCSVVFDSYSNHAGCHLRAYQNEGSKAITYLNIARGNDTDEQVTLNGSTVFNCVSGDTISFYVEQSTGTDKNILGGSDLGYCYVYKLLSV